MRKALTLALLVPALAVGGCSIFQKEAKSLDEFAVARNAPLVIPPDYALTPPVAGTISTSAEGSQAQAICYTTAEHQAAIAAFLQRSKP